VEDFKRRFDFVQRMTVDFAAAVPDAHWHFSPQLPAPDGAAAAGRHGDGFAPFCKQLRHVVCVRGVYAESIVTKRADFSKTHSHYTGALTREELMVALDETHGDLLAKFEVGDARATIDFFGTPFTLGDLAYTVVQHEAIHHGQWSVYAALARFETPVSWRDEWGL
jgi:hypothetical protein